MSKNSQAVLTAAAKGYTVNESGQVIAPSGAIRKLYVPRNPRKQYAEFGISSEAGKVAVPVHRLAAVLKFGPVAVSPGVHVRHLNGNSLDNRPDNIAIGNHSQNMMDRSKADRVAHAQKAGRANSLPDDLWREIERRHAEGMSYKAIRAEYRISLGTLSYRLSRTGKKTVLR